MLATIINRLGNWRTDSITTTRLTLYGAPAYAILGAIGLILAIGPGYASPVFPASGLALALLLWFGPRALPSVTLGSFALNMATALQNGSLNQTTLALALLIAGGSSAQAFAGYWLVNRWQGAVWRNLERELDALIFLLLGGVLPCLISASIGVTGLHLSALISQGDIYFSWWNWYVGDTLGVLIFAPLLLQLLNRSTDRWNNQRRYLFMPVLLIMMLIWLAFFGTGQIIRKDQKYRLKNDCETITKQIADRLLTHREVLTSLHNFIKATPDFSFKQFELFTQISLKNNSDIFALSFNDLVTNDQRLVFEKKISALSPLGPFQITERDSEKRLIRAHERPEYVAVRNIVPLAGNKPAVGFDINSEPIRRDAINRARTSKNMAVTSPIQLVQEQKKRVGVLELMPIYEASFTDSGEQRSDNLLGFAVSVVKVDELIDIATRGYLPGGLLFQVTDLNAPKGNELLYRSDAARMTQISAVQDGDWKTELRMGDRNWQLTAFTTDVYLQQQRPFIAWGIGLIAIFATGLVQLLIIGMAGRSNEVRRTNNAVNAYLDKLFSDSNIPIIVWDSSLKITRFSKALEVLTGWSADEIISKSIATLFPITDVDSSLELINKAVIGERWETVELPILHINGSINTVLWNSSPIFGEDGTTLVATIAQGHDITARKQMENELQKRSHELGETNERLKVEIQERQGAQDELALKQTQLEELNSSLQRRIAEALAELRQKDQMMISQGRQAAMGEMIGNIAHQWRQPINALAMVLGNIRQAYYYKELTDKYIEDTVDNGNRLIQKMSTTINDFRNFFLPDKEAVSFSARDQIKHAVSLVVSGLENQNIRIHLETDSDLTLTGFPNEYSQVLLNLLSNSREAIKESKVAEGHITIRLFEQDGEGCVTFSDNGGGIKNDVIDKIFEPYFSTKEMGTGIGLYMSKMIIERSMNGTIEAKNSDGGAEFVIKTPLDRKLP